MKEKLIDIIKQPNDKLIAVDLDGTLCKGEFRGEGEPTAILSTIEKVNNLYKKGAHIIIYTARPAQYYEDTVHWLEKYQVLYHGIAMRKKIGADVYIDDKALNVDDFIAVT